MEHQKSHQLVSIVYLSGHYFLVLTMFSLCRQLLLYYGQLTSDKIFVDTQLY